MSFDPWVIPNGREVIAGIRDGSRRVVMPDDSLFDGELRGYQHDGVAHLYLTRNILLGDSTGVGKTVQSLYYLRQLKVRGELSPSRPALVVVTPSIMDMTWAEDGFSKFTPRSLGVEYVSGVIPAAKRRALYESKGFEVLCISYDTLKRDARHLLYGFDEGFSTIIFDEASVMRNHESMVARECKRLSRFSSRVVLLSATPVQTELLNLHSLLEVMQLGGLFGSRQAFLDSFYNYRLVKRRFGRRVVTQHEVDENEPYKNIDVLRERMWPFYFRRSYSDLEPGSMPEINAYSRWVDMTKYQREIYDLVRKTEPRKTDALSLRNKAMRLKQVTTGTQTYDPSLVDSSAKLDWLLDALATDWSSGGLDGGPLKIVVFSLWKQTIMTIKARLDRAGVGSVVVAGKSDLPSGREFPYGTLPSERAALRKTFFESRECQVLVGTSAIEMGLSLQVAPVLVNVDLMTNPGRATQVAGRVARANSEYDTVQVISLLARDTLDQRMLELLVSRQDIADQVNDVSSGSNMFSRLSHDELRRLVG